MKKTLLFLALMFVLSMVSYAQAVGDYGSANATGTWTTATDWVICATAGTWSGATVAGATPGQTNNVWIRNGHSMAFTTSAKTCLNLHIDNGGTLHGTNGTTPVYVRVYGNLTNNGTMGNGTLDALSLGVYSASCVISGTGTTYISRIQPTVASGVIEFNTDVTVSYIGTPTSGSAGIYCNAVGTTFTIDAGKTLTMVPNSYFAVGSSGSADPSSGANLTINVYGTLTTSTGTYSSINLANTSSYSSTLHVYSTGTVNCGHSMWAPAAGAASSVTVIVDAGGKVNFTDASGTCDLSKATTTMNGTWDYNNVSTATRSLGSTASVGGKIRSKSSVLATAGTITLNSGSTVEYYGTSAIPSVTVTPVYNLLINNSGGVTLGNSIVATNALTLTSGTVTLGAYNLTAGSVSGGSTSSYVVTNGSGGFIQNVPGTSTSVSFPVGYTDTYTPVVLNNSGTADNFTAAVKNTFDNAPYTNQVVNKQWTITEAGTGANVAITLQWNTADETGTYNGFIRTNPVYIGMYNSPIWQQTLASYTDLGGGVYTASASGYTAFSSFAVGNVDALPVELSAFTSNVNGRDINLNWTTKTEKNSDKFEIERMVNLVWTNIGSVKASVLSNSPKQYSYIDKNLQAGKYQYRLKMVDNDGSFQYSQIIETEVSVPKNFGLSQNYPNPFNPSTKINYDLASDSKVTLEVYSITGERIDRKSVV